MIEWRRKQLIGLVGKMVNVFNEKLSLHGILRKRLAQDSYRVDLMRNEGYYCFDLEDVIVITTENSNLIALK